MRVRAVNEKAVAKLIAYLTDLRKDLADGIFVTGHVLQTKHAVSKSTYSVCQKLEIIVDQTWNNAFDTDRKTAVKILEYLRQRSDRQTDKPISDLWCQEIAAIKELLTQVRDNTKKQNKGLEGFKISERVYIAGQIASGIYTEGTRGDSIASLSSLIVMATDDLLKQLNQ